MFENERQLDRGLEALAAGLSEQAPPEVKARLKAAFWKKKSRRYSWVGIAAAAAILLLLVPARRESVVPAVFMALDDGPTEAGLVVRMKLPRSILGDDGATGEVEADVLLGDDGLAHAIRFVK